MKLYAEISIDQNMPSATYVAFYSQARVTTKEFNAPLQLMHIRRDPNGECHAE